MNEMLSLRGLLDGVVLGFGYCSCGCGHKTNIIEKSNVGRNRVAGQPYKSLYRHRRPAWLRVLDKVVEDDAGCWIYTGGIHRNGYGQVGIDGRTKELAHRAIWKRHNKVDSIPRGMYVMHKCDRPACVNPDHLELGTPSQNNQDGWNRGRGTDCCKCGINRSSYTTGCRNCIERRRHRSKKVDA